MAKRQQASRLELTDIPIHYEAIEQDIERVFDHFEAAFVAANLNARYVLADHELQVRTSDPDYLAMAGRAIASHSGAPNSSSRFVVGVAGENGVPALVWGSACFEQRRLETTLRNSRYRMYFLPEWDFWQVYDSVSKRGFQIMASKVGYPDWDPGSPLRNLVHWCLESKTRALTHAGTLAVDGHGVLLAGAGGSGKSGTVVCGLMRGLQTVGDDYVLLDGTNMTAHALFKTLKQDSRGVERLGLNSNPAIPKHTNWQDKHQFYWDDLKRHEPQSEIRLHALLCPQVSGSTKTRVVTISDKEAFLALAPSGVSQIPGDRAQLSAIAAKVARVLPSYRLELGENPDEVADTLRAFIAKAKE